MSINDVWRRIDRHLGVYVDGRFDEVPASPGVYAWFYPLKVPAHDLDNLINELRNVFSYDAILEREGIIESAVDLNWETILFGVSKQNRAKGVPNGIYEEWKCLLDKPEEFKEFRKALMGASLLMPPLYIGKATVLRNRCSQHLVGKKDKSGFKKRFENFAIDNKLTTKFVKDLIFVCIQTKYKEQNSNHGYDNSQSLLEEILKLSAKPPYGIK